jgi:hypothetical protein
MPEPLITKTDTDYRPPASEPAGADDHPQLPSGLGRPGARKRQAADRTGQVSRAKNNGKRGARGAAKTLTRDDSLSSQHSSLRLAGG